MKDYKQKRLEFEKRLDTIIGGYSYAQDGGNGGYEFKDITDYIDTFITQAEQKMLKRVVGEIEKIYPISDTQDDSCDNFKQKVLDLLSSLDKEINNNK